MPTHLICLLAALAGGQAPTGVAEKQAALHQPVCLIPMGESIDLPDLPTSTYRQDWIKNLPGDRPISLVSIPATHDTGTALARTGGTRCQVLTVPAQLAVGVRGFDVRLRVVGSDLKIYHGVEFQHLDFKDVMEAYDRFLTKHPSEFLIVRISEEAKAIDSSEPLETAFERHIAPYRKLFYRPASRSEIPTVGNLRGKILILDHYGKLGEGIDYPNPSMSVQDDYDISNMDRKYQEIVGKFVDALCQKDGTVWNVNYTSSSTFAVDQLANARAVNAKVLDWLAGKVGTLGLVLMNFPSVDVIDRVISSNF